MATPEETAAAEKAAQEKAAADKAAAGKAAADKAAAEKAAAEAAGKKGSGDGDGSAGDADFTSGTGDDDAGGKGSTGDKTGGGAPDLKLDIPKDLQGRVPTVDATEYLALAKKQGLTQQQLDEWASTYFDDIRDQLEAVKETAAEWRRDVIRDATLGGSVEKAKASFQVAMKGARALDRSGELGRAFKAYMDGVPYGKGPDGEDLYGIPGPLLMRALHFAGLAEIEDNLGDQPGGGGARGGDARSAEQRRIDKRYPSLKEKQAGAAK